MPNVAWERRANTPESLDSPAGTDKEKTQQKQISKNTSRNPILLSPEFSCRQTHCLQHFICASRSRMFRMDSKQFFRLVIKLLFTFAISRFKPKEATSGEPPEMAKPRYEVQSALRQRSLTPLLLGKYLLKL